MIRITTIGNGDSVYLIPGGPGLSSQTIRSFDPLASDYCLNYIDFPGTNKNVYDRDRSFDELCTNLAKQVLKKKGKIFIIGHSYGGLIASKVAHLTNANALICLATPFSSEALDEAVKRYSLYQSKELKLREENWIQNPSDNTFKEWLASYEELYFTKDKVIEGRKLILEDNVSSSFFLNNGSDIRSGKFQVSCLKTWNKPHLLLAGEKDGLLPVDSLKKDASEGQFDFMTIPEANHFLHIDNQSYVNNVVRDFFSKAKKETV